MVLSFALQALALTIAVVISILTVDKLGAISLPAHAADAACPKAIEIVDSIGALRPPSHARSARRQAVCGADVTFRSVCPGLQDGPEMIGIGHGHRLWQ